MSDYEEIVKKIKEGNEPLIQEFKMYLKDEGLAPKTIKSHIDNIYFFSEYLVYYEPYQSLEEADTCEVSGFLGDFFPRKAMWACPTSIKSYIATFKKLFKWMINEDKMNREEYEYLIELIKEEKEDWFSSVSFEDDYY